MTAPRDLPLTPYQESLFFLQKLTPESPFYTNGIAVRLRGRLDVPALGLALGDLVRHHPALRANFDLVMGRPVQRIAEPTAISPPVSDLTLLPPVSRLAAAQAQATNNARRPFELSSDPALRVSLSMIGPDDHVLSLVAHHIVSDGLSLFIVIKDLSAAYAFRTGHAGRPDLPRPSAYLDYCRRYDETRHAARARDERDLSYWRKRLRGADLTVDLRTDRPRPAVRARTGDAISAVLPDEVADRLRLARSAHGVSAFVLLLASFRVLLAYETGQRDIPIAATVSRRTRVELRRLVGYLVNPVLMRTPLEHKLSFTALLDAEQRTTLSALAHAEVPFPQVVGALRPPRIPGADPLFQVLLDYQAVQPEQSLLAGFTRCGLSASIADLDTATAQVELACCAQDNGQSVRLTYRYDSELFNRSTVESMAQRHRLLLSALIDEPGRPVTGHSLLTARERHLVLDSGRGRTVPNEGRRVQDLFHSSVDAAPNRVALAEDGRVLTYQQLDRLANVGAHRLREAGLGPGELCVVWTRRLDIATSTALLAILKAGGAYIAFDPSHPRDRLTGEIRRLSLRFAVEPHPGAVPMTTVPLPTDIDAIRSGDRDERPSPIIGAPGLAYAISTSGSTGRPKVVGLSHGNAVNFLNWARRHFTVEELSAVLATTSPVFDCTLFELFAPLCAGGTAVLAESPLDLPRLANIRRVSLVSTVPSTMEQLLRSGRLPRSLRAVNLAGESLPADMPKQIFAVSQVKRVFNFYGPSETTTYATGHLYLRPQDSTGADRRDSERTIGSIIGRPIDNVRIYVLDGDRLVPPGMAGELCIGGAGVGIGYLGDPDKTAAAFVADPFATVSGATMYRSGDRVRFSAHGDLEFIGRLDRQLKIRGIRVEPADVETALREHPAVRGAAVVPIAEEAGSAEGLLAFVTPTVATDGTEHRAVDLMPHLEARLPRHLTPKSVVWMDELPLTANGKLDRQALPAIKVSRAPDLLPGPTGFVEHALLDIFRTVLGRAGISRFDDFFDIGGNSLLAMVVLAMTADELGANVSLDSFMLAPSIKALAALIEPGWVPRSQNSLLAVAPGGSDLPLFMVHGGSGEVSFLHALTEAVDFGRPVYGLRSRGLNGWGSPLEEVPEMAAAYLAEIRSVAPRGPYFLAGNCMGGLIAYEMAQRIWRDGAEVAFLGLINTLLPEDGTCQPAAATADADVSVRESAVEKRLAALRHEYEALGAGSVIDGDLSAAAAAGRPSFFRRWIQVALTNDNAANSYRPASYPHEIHLFTDDASDAIRDQWRPLLQGAVHLHRFPPQPGQLASRPDLGLRMRGCVQATTPALGRTATA